jgi:hypothetical protein
MRGEHLIDPLVDNGDVCLDPFDPPEELLGVVPVPALFSPGIERLRVEDVGDGNE